jgi:hypothetical protein
MQYFGYMSGVVRPKGRTPCALQPLVILLRSFYDQDIELPAQGARITASGQSLAFHLAFQYVIG